MSDQTNEYDEIRTMMREAMAQNISGYDQSVAGYKEVLDGYIAVGDVARHNLGEDLVIPAVGSVIDAQTEVLLNEFGPQKVIFDLCVLLSCAIDDILTLTHNREGVES